jgi:hypothetical protein
MRSSKSAILITTILIFSGIMVVHSINNTHAAAIPSELTPGDTVWYSLDKFTSFEDLSNDQDLVHGTLQGSEVYVKIMDINEESMTYWDGDQHVSAKLPTVDLSTGLILGSDISIDVPVDESNDVYETVTIPEGSGFPLPFTFGTVTQFNITEGSVPEMLFPFPLVLNDDWTLHEALLQEAASFLPADVASVSITNSATSFSIDIQLEDPESTDFVHLVAAWRKSDGLLDNAEASGDVEGDTFEFSISFDRKESRPLQLDVGDKWELSVKQLGFDYSLSGFDPTQQNEIADQLDQIDSQISSIEGTKILSLEVKEIDGLYYRVDGQVYDPETESMMTLSDFTDGVDLWMNGFGPVHYRGFGFASLGGGLTISTCYYDYYGYEVCESSGPSFNGFTDEEIKRVLNFPGIVMTPDWDIYQAWDKTISAGVEGLEGQIVAALNGVDSDVFGDVNLGFSTTKVNNGEYKVKASAHVDITSNYDGSRQKIDASAEVAYADHGALKMMKASGSYSITDGPQKIEIKNAVAEFTVDFNTVNTRETDAPAPDNGAGNPLGDLPGFGFYFAILSLFAVSTILRKRN